MKELENFIMKELRNAKSWKVRKYSKFLKIEGFSFKTKSYLRWKTSNTILKFRTFCSILNRYSYVYHKKSTRNTEKKKLELQYCPHCKHKIENLSHFIWKCQFYKKSREKWKEELKHILTTDQYHAIIERESSYQLFSFLIHHYPCYISTSSFFKKFLFFRFRNN